jgi:hypothetical protein
MKPSLVILSVLLADDLQQVFEALDRQAGLSPDPVAGMTGNAKAVVKWALPGLYKLFRAVKYGGNSGGGTETGEPRPISESMEAENFRLLEERLSSFPPQLRQAVLEGQINLGLIQFADAYPDRSWRFWDAFARGDIQAQSKARFIAGEFAELADEVRTVGGTLMVFAMPSGEFVESRFTDSYRIYGASIPEANLSSQEPENGLREIARLAGADFVGSLDAFRGFDAADTFFPTDGHLNKAGNTLIASILYAAIVAESTN